jgi:site-specific DNA-cytosine methylase
MKPLRKVKAYFAFGGIGGLAIGAQMAERELFGRRAVMEVIGGVDIDPNACADFQMYTRVPEACADVLDMTVEDLWKSSFGLEPDVLGVTGPCQGGSKLISDQKAQEAHYQSLNGLSVQFMQLAIVKAGWRPGYVFFENVLNIEAEARGGWMLREMNEILARVGYSYSIERRELGADGGLAQRRKRLIGLWRLPTKVPSLCFQPSKKRLRACGEVLEGLPLPNAAAGGDMHWMPNLEWTTWLRLSLIPPGGDHRDIPGVLKDLQARREVFRRHHVSDWHEPTPCIAGDGSNGVRHVSDPRLNCAPFAGTFGVPAWERTFPTVVGRSQIDKSRCGAVADPRPGRGNGLGRGGGWFPGGLGVVRMTEAMGTVKARNDVSTGAFAVADIRVKRAFDKGYGVLHNEPAHTIAGTSFSGCGAYAWADPRADHRASLIRGAVGPIPLEQALKTMDVPAPWAIVDPSRPGETLCTIAKPDGQPSAYPIILRPDGYWNRPLSPWELLGLMAFPLYLGGRPVRLAGSSTSKWRTRIGNAVPPLAAAAFFRRILASYLAADAGTTLMSDGTDIWVSPWNDPDHEIVEDIIAPLPPELVHPELM